MSDVIPASKQFRAKVAAAVAAGTAPPSITHAAWGTNGDPASDDDQALGNEVHRQPVDSATAQDTLLTVLATLRGADVEGYAVREIAIIDSDGDLAGRRAFRPLELEPGTEIETTLTLQF
ncbi:MAG: phage tail protein [Halomonas sp.]|nr:phage tail protein [Halomonas sp.]NQY77913.1 phage tail protein [Halomonas sp.]